MASGRSWAATWARIGSPFTSSTASARAGRSMMAGFASSSSFTSPRGWAPTRGRPDGSVCRRRTPPWRRTHRRPAVTARENSLGVAGVAQVGHRSSLPRCHLHGVPIRDRPGARPRPSPPGGRPAVPLGAQRRRGSGSPDRSGAAPAPRASPRPARWSSGHRPVPGSVRLHGRPPGRSCGRRRPRSGRRARSRRSPSHMCPSCSVQYRAAGTASGARAAAPEPHVVHVPWCRRRPPQRPRPRAARSTGGRWSPPPRARDLAGHVPACSGQPGSRRRCPGGLQLTGTASR